MQFLALASFELALRLVDHVDAAFATHNTAITVPVLERAERVLDLHGSDKIVNFFSSKAKTEKNAKTENSTTVSSVRARIDHRYDCHGIFSSNDEIQKFFCNYSFCKSNN